MGYHMPVVGDSDGVVGGRDLRYLLTLRLRELRGPTSVAELVEWCGREGIVLPGRASKVISDSLRWEINWGRVVRLSRGVYQFRRIPRSTLCWMLRRARAALAHVQWASRTRAGEPNGAAPLWGPVVTTPPGTGRRTQQPGGAPFDIYSTPGRHRRRRR